MPTKKSTGSQETSRSQLLDLTSLVGTGHGHFCQHVLVHVGSLSGLQEFAALHDRRAAISLVMCAPQHAVYVDNFACIGLDAKQVQLQTTKSPILHGPRACPYTLLPRQVRKMNSWSFPLMESMGASAAKIRFEGALRRNALSGASLRRLVGHLSYAFLLRRPCL